MRPPIRAEGRVQELAARAGLGQVSGQAADHDQPGHDQRGGHQDQHDQNAREITAVLPGEQDSGSAGYTDPAAVRGAGPAACRQPLTSPGLPSRRLLTRSRLPHAPTRRSAPKPPITGRHAYAHRCNPHLRELHEIGRARAARSWSINRQSRSWCPSGCRGMVREAALFRRLRAILAEPAGRCDLQIGKTGSVCARCPQPTIVTS